jgi:flagellar basal-body rod modification protein FlgD
MATAPIGPTTNLSSTASANLKLDDLLRVLMTELTHQNPFKPVENKDFMAQIAQFASLDSSQRLNQNVEQMLLLQAVNQSVGLIGRTVTARADEGSITGKVIALSLADGVPRMTISTADGRSVVGIAIGDLELVQ